MFFLTVRWALLREDLNGKEKIWGGAPPSTPRSLCIPVPATRAVGSGLLIATDTRPHSTSDDFSVDVHPVNFENACVHFLMDGRLILIFNFVYIFREAVEIQYDAIVPWSVKFLHTARGT